MVFMSVAILGDGELLPSASLPNLEVDVIADAIEASAELKVITDIEKFTHWLKFKMVQWLIY